MAPYQRPPLSKGFLTGDIADATLPLRSENFYSDNGIVLQLNSRVDRIDRDAKRLELRDGRRMYYGQLALAVGSRPRTVTIPGSDYDGVISLRTVMDARSLKARITSASSIAVVGGGFIGLEVAAVCAALGKDTTVIEALDRLLMRSIPARLAEYIAEVHRAQGVRLLLSTRVREIAGTNSRVQAVRCTDGTEVPADLVLIAVGVVPNVELARECGLPCDNGILVNNSACTDDPAIVSAGDCTNHPSRYAGGRIRLESVQNAIDQAKVAGLTVAGVKAVHDGVPWFWSDQYHLRLQMAGLSQGYDQEVLRGSLHEAKFSVFYLRAGRLIAADSVNRSAEHMLCRRMIAAQVAITAEQAGDDTFDLKSLALSATVHG